MKSQTGSGRHGSTGYGDDTKFSTDERSGGAHPRKSRPVSAGFWPVCFAHYCGLVRGKRLLSNPKGTVPSFNDPNMVANGENIILFLDNNQHLTTRQLDFKFPGWPGPSSPLHR